LRRRFDELQENDALYANAIDALWRERAAQRVILRKSRAVLPEWLQTYVDNISRGVSPW
jgi:hypothetical protein